MILNNILFLYDFYEIYIFIKERRGENKKKKRAIIIKFRLLFSFFKNIYINIFLIFAAKLLVFSVC